MIALCLLLASSDLWLAGGPRDVVVVNGKIAAGAPPANATKIDVKGKVVTPGFIEMVSDLGLTEVSAEPSAREGRGGGPITPAQNVLEAFNPRSVWIPVARAGGITSTMVIPGGGAIAGRGAWIDLVALPKPDPERPIAFFGSVAGTQAFGGSRSVMWMRLREAFLDARFYKANKKGYDAGAARALSLPLTQLEAMQPLVDGKALFSVEANRASDILAVLAFAKEQNVRVVIFGAAEAHLVTKELLDAKAAVVITPSALVPSAFDQLHTRDDVATLLHQAGVPFAISTLGSIGITRLGQEAGRAVAFGLPHDKALEAITAMPAKLYGRADLGSLEPGKRANLVVWSGDPLEVTSVVERVFIDGVEQVLDTRQQALVKRYLKAPRSP